MHVNLLVLLVRELGGIDVVIITAAIIATAGVTTIGDADRVILGLGVGVVRADLFLGQFSLFGLTYSSKETSSSGWSDMSRGGVTVIIVQPPHLQSGHKCGVVVEPALVVVV
jgi:hypothetical protein